MGFKFRTKLGLFLIAAILAGAVAPAQQKIKVKDLAPQYQDWLKLVGYIITDQERDVFLKLTRDIDRNLFIDTFWKKRDPTPETPENEYKDEILKRFQYVNKFYHRGASQEGWQTDMGRIYMILGAPQNIERFEGKLGIVPCQVWSFYGDIKKGLPNYFQLIFFQKGGAGPFKLYDPLADGPYQLLENKKNITPDDYDTLYEQIKNLAPTLLSPAFTIVPGEYNYGSVQPPVRNAIIMASIFDSPKKEINPSYATHFLDYVGVVNTDYMTNYVESDAVVDIIPDPATGLTFVHFNIAPKSISVDYYDPKSQYYCNYRMDVSFRKDDKILLQYSREVPWYFQEDTVDKVKSNGLAFEDTLPVAEGKYKLMILLQNSVGKEFTLFEQNLDIKPLPTKPSLFGPFLGYRIEKYSRDTHIPFKIGDSKLVIDPQNNFSLSDQIAVLVNVVSMTEELHQKGKLRFNIVRMSNEGAPAKLSAEVDLGSTPFDRIVEYKQIFLAKDLTPDYYEMVVDLVDGTGQVLDEKRQAFVVSSSVAVGHPIANARALPLSRQYVYYYVLASQYDKMDQNERAAQYYRTAFASFPDYKEGVLDYCHFLLKTKEYDTIFEVAARLKDDAGKQFDYHHIRGQAFLGKGEYKLAVTDLLQANSIYNSDTDTLNSLGLAYYKLGDKARAAAALKASLSMNPDQADAKKLLAEVEGGKP